MTEVTTSAGSKVVSDKWVDPFFKLMHERDDARAERDRARDVAVAMEQEIAELWARVERVLFGGPEGFKLSMMPDQSPLLDYSEDDFDVWTDHSDREEA